MVGGWGLGVGVLGVGILGLGSGVDIIQFVRVVTRAQRTVKGQGPANSFPEAATPIGPALPIPFPF